MTLHEIRPGLRVINKGNSVSKVTLVIQPGDELEVSEDVAAQLDAQTQDFVPATPDVYKRTVPYPPPPEEVEVVEDTESRPAKRAAKKAPRK